MNTLASFDLIAAAPSWLPGWMVWLGDWENVLTVVKVLLGLNLVIFVHELGHFAVAKWCGVKCDKFYIWFDPPLKLGWGKYSIRLPSRICKFQWGETEYGIGVIPLGGYVKMLGQDDNPSQAAEAVRQARLKAEVKQEAAAAGTTLPATNMVSEGSPVDAPTAAEEQYVFDPRSYMAKTVPQRMAIISAGVVMNVIFAVIFAAVAYGMGVPYNPAVVGHVVAGEGAWRANFQSGDKIVQINDKPLHKFMELRTKLSSLTEDDVKDGVDVLIERDGKQITLKVFPKAKEHIIRLGVSPPILPVLDEKKPTFEDTPAATAGFEPLDSIASVNKQPVKDYRDLARALATFQDEPLEIVVNRTSKTASPDAKPTVTQVTLKVDKRPARDLGFAMKFGPVTDVQADSPAAAAGVQAGDKLVSFDGAQLAEADPLYWPDDLRRLAAMSEDKEYPLVVDRDGKPVTLSVRLRKPNTTAQIDGTAPVAALALGLAYSVSLEVQSVRSGGAAEGKLQPGDKVVNAQIVPANDDAKEKEVERYGPYGIAETGIDFTKTDESPSWGAFFDSLQSRMPDTTIKLTVKRGDATEVVTLPISAAANRFRAERGLSLKGWEEIEKADSFGEAISLGMGETGDALTAVARFLRKIAYEPRTGKHLGSVLSIGGAAGIAAKKSWADLLIFLTLISANLAVINFLPIPVLDGGHMVFLAYEGIRGKPADERVFGILTMVGFVLLLSLMVFVFWLDINRFIIGG